MNKQCLKHKEQIFFHGEEYFASLIQDINNAVHSIDLETYIFSLDEIGKQIVDCLINAVKRNVTVRVLVDGAGTTFWGNHQIQKLEKLGGKTRIFHPFPWRLWHLSRAYVQLPSLLKAIYFFLTINSRNHRKVCIIDKKIAYIGSFNISSDHIDNNKKHSNGWRDTGIKLTQTNLNELQQAFDTAWDHLPINERVRQIFKHVYTNPIFRLNYNRHRRRILYKNLLRRITRCQKRIWITNAYFVPDNFLLRKLQESAISGKDVRILLPYKSDLLFMPWASKTFYERLLKSGVRIFEYLPAILHAKTLILDDWMLIGSSNLNHRSLLHDLEIDINIRTEESKQSLEKQFLLDLQQSQEITLKSWRKPPFYQRFFGGILLYLKYWF